MVVGGITDLDIDTGVCRYRDLGCNRIYVGGQMTFNLILLYVAILAITYLFFYSIWGGDE